MDDEKLLRNLKSIGMRVFVEYFNLFSNTNLSTSDVVELLFSNEDFTEKSCRSRAGHAKSIFDAGRAKDALRIITNATRVDMSIRKNASQLLDDISGSSRSCVRSGGGWR